MISLKVPCYTRPLFSDLLLISAGSKYLNLYPKIPGNVLPGSRLDRSGILKPGHAKWPNAGLDPTRTHLLFDMPDLNRVYIYVTADCYINKLTLIWKLQQTCVLALAFFWCIQPSVWALCEHVSSLLLTQWCFILWSTFFLSCEWQTQLVNSVLQSEATNITNHNLDRFPFQNIIRLWLTPTL